MKINVTPNNVSIAEEYVINRGEYNVTPLEFNFSDEYSTLVKKAIFASGDTKIEVAILNDTCNIPIEVLNEKEIELRVYAYEVQEEQLILRYSPTYTKLYTREGSYIEGGVEPEVITPSQFEQYMQAMNDGLEEVQNVDIDAEKIGSVTTIIITNRDGTTKSVQIADGAKGDKGDKGDTGNTGAKGDKGEQGQKGNDGADATINGVNTLTIEAGNNININQSGNTMTISSTGGSGGTSDYADLTNKPSINNITLTGNKTLGDLGIVIPDITGKEDTSNKVTSITASSTDAQYPSAKAVYDLFNSITDAEEVYY